MSDFQFWTLFASLITLISGAMGWLMGWVKGISNRVSEQEKEIAVIKAIMEERKHDRYDN